MKLFAFPVLMSYVEGVEIGKVTVIERSATHSAMLEVEIRNNTSREAIGLLLCSADTRDSTCIGASGGTVLAAHGIFMMTFPVPNLHAGRPLSVSAVVWKAGSVSGHPFVLRCQGICGGRATLRLAHVASFMRRSKSVKRGSERRLSNLGFTLSILNR